MNSAPQGALFVWVNDELHYPQRLARHLGRTDLRITSAHWLRVPHGTELEGIPAIVIDHAVRMGRREHDGLHWAEARIARMR